MKNVDGGIVKDVFPFMGNTATIGMWSGGKWGPQNQFVVHQFRNHSLVGYWQVMGVDIIHRRDAVFFLAPQGSVLSLAKDDILIFGEGAYTILPVKETDLPIERDRAVEVGEQRFHGVALWVQGRVQDILFFHEEGKGLIERNGIQPVWSRDRRFSFQPSFSEEDMPAKGLSRKGLLYGVDLTQNWCRVLVKDNGKTEEWTLNFSEEMRNQVEGMFPREVVVSFETQELPDSNKGTGKLLSIRKKTRI